MKTKQILVSIMILVMLFLHFDFWNWGKIDPIVFGWLPIGLFYHVVYCFVFAAILWLLNVLWWPDPPKGWLKED